MILYKRPIEFDTLYIVGYIHSLGHQDVVDNMIIVERNHIEDINGILPSIFVDGIYYLGLENIVKYYEHKYKITDLLKKSKLFNEKFPNYKIKN